MPAWVLVRSCQTPRCICVGYYNSDSLLSLELCRPVMVLTSFRLISREGEANTWNFVIGGPSDG